MKRLHNFLGKIRWWLWSTMGLPGRSDAEVMYQIDRLPCRSIPGAKFRFPWGKLDYVASTILRAQFFEIFVKRQYAFISKSAAPVIVDGGGNIGLSVIWFKRTFPDCRLTVYEADPDMASRLSLNLLTAGISDVEVQNAAIWVKDGFVAFDNVGEDRGSVRPNGAIQVRSIDIARCLPDRVDLLKLDVEGAEFAILERLCQEGAIARVQNLVAEFHVRRTDIDNFINALERLRKCGLQVAMTSAIGPWLGLAEVASPFEAVGRDQMLFEVYAWR